MTVLVNGRVSNQISVHDRGLLYGQSLFETIAVNDGRPCLLAQHLQRLRSGAQRLGIPFAENDIINDVQSIASKQAKAVIRVTLTFGVGGRGYLNPIEAAPTRIVSLHPYPEHPVANWGDGIELGVADIRLSHQPSLAGLKHGNRLEQIIARSQWQESWGEALLLDTDGRIVEATQSNVFIIKNNQLLTPDLSLCGVAGVMRDFVLSQADKVGVAPSTVSLSVADIERADAVFVCNSVIGLWPVARFLDRDYRDFSIPNKLLEIMIKNEAIPNI